MDPNPRHAYSRPGPMGFSAYDDRHYQGAALQTVADVDSTVVRLPSDDPDSFERSGRKNTDGDYRIFVPQFNFFGTPGTYQVAFWKAAVGYPTALGPTTIRVSCNIPDLSREGSSVTSTIHEQRVDPAGQPGPWMVVEMEARELVFQSVVGGNITPVIVTFTNNEGVVFNTNPSGGEGLDPVVPPSQLSLVIRRARR